MALLEARGVTVRFGGNVAASDVDIDVDGGRITGVFVMFSGVALIGVLASYLANFFLAPPKKAEEERAAPDTPEGKLRELRDLLDEQEKANAALREKLAEYESMAK